ncbi:Uncharacterised protein [BD1-7 clade bacterium]|uniref:Thioesterase domain-containing protein n=1 Tax=BD1-7 clade bacterium TaxID=2029982 RepID=A0A5S9N3Q3_9GAMM|nr:Uncharacterised protein [BD1-7 clade bacterium]CAA0084365.1 Uncharacterised protein [BD1-7 clade bacterium]
MQTTNPELTQFIRDIVENLNHCKSLGIKVGEANRGHLTLLLPYADHLIGNPDTGVIHGGALTTLMDTACGFAAVCALDEFGIAPTLDLRIDYMRPATPGKTIVGDAEAYHVTSNVIFARGMAYHEDDPDNPIAHCTASFMRLSQPTQKPQNGGAA